MAEQANVEIAMTDTSTQRRPMACYHEADHALARWFFGYETDRIVVLPKSELQGRAQGFVAGPEITPLFGATRWAGEGRVFSELVRTFQRQTAEKKLVVIHAGLSAQSVYTKRSISAEFFRGLACPHPVAQV